MKGLKIKICGMREPWNIREISTLLPDYLGYIFHPGSKRYAGDLSPDIRTEISAFIKTVGVFVNETEEKLVRICSEYGIGTVQLHGNESPDYCERLAEKGLRIIKVFHIKDKLDSNSMQPFGDTCSYFLFDTATDSFGGSGAQFDWGLLEDYTLEIPFLLSGGIGMEDAGKVLSIDHPMLFGIDVNSRFELSPGIKDPESCEAFIKTIRSSPKIKS
jgi:phosphoribosylanthranilate isomerase